MKSFVSFSCFLLLPVVFVLQAKSEFVCQSEIYCRGKLLHDVQMASLFDDSKTFVDMKMKLDANETMEEFHKTENEIYSYDPRKVPIQVFLERCFEPSNSEFVPWVPQDWVESPEFLNNITDKKLNKFASDLNLLWKDLGRKMNSSIKNEQDKYSIIYVDHPVIVPGGRFREFYYWDSYWIIQGLLLSEMKDTVKGMLENFLGLVEKFGFVPNGGRIYYDRSQPPLLAPMVKSYYDKTDDLDFLKKHTQTLEKELQFWLQNRTIEVRGYKVAVYKQKSGGPRPESYREDIKSAAFFKNQTEKEEFYKEIKSAAESGWDFSSRWFVAKNKTNIGDLTDMKTSTIVPVDLNAILHWNARLVSEFYGLIGNKTKSDEYDKVAENFKEILDKLLWNDKYGVWMDFDSVNMISRPYFYPSNLAPLWTRSYHNKYGKDDGLDEDAQSRVKKVLEYLKSEDVNITRFEGGVPTSLLETGEQWDYPNAWAPLQHMVILGLDSTGNEDAQEMALDLCQNWVRSNYKAYIEKGRMYEKYNATQPGVPGDGGEYEVQLGFGWTNGVILDLLNRYGRCLSVDSKSLISGECKTKGLVPFDLVPDRSPTDIKRYVNRLCTYTIDTMQSMHHISVSH